jgi:hypothetical protein
MAHIGVSESEQEPERRGEVSPSGLHMSDQDLPRRLTEYGAPPIYLMGDWGTHIPYGTGSLSLCRLALTERDIRTGGLLSFPAEDKRTDPRYRWYRAQGFARCWELDALSPAVLRDRLREAITSMIDKAVWNRALKVELAERQSLEEVLGTWRQTCA